MTNQPHDQFAKQYLEAILSPLGTVDISLEVTSEVRQVDLYFSPSSTAPPTADLGLLGQMVATPCAIEPFRNSPSNTEIRNCLLKLFSLHSQLQRKANRDRKTLSENDLPVLWILTHSASDRTIDSFQFTESDRWQSGVYFLAEALKTRLIAINQLPETPETLWLRILGKGRLQERAILELVALAKDNPLRSRALEQVAVWRVNLEMQTNPTREERELMMTLSPAYLQWREEAIQQGLQQGVQQGLQQGVQQGQRMMLENMLKVRFGAMDEALAIALDRLLQLPPQEAVSLVLQLNREELLNRLDNLDN
jgi:bisphosphoglycerate-dependent phosphoglycerate mutase